MLAYELSFFIQQSKRCSIKDQLPSVSVAQKELSGGNLNTSNNNGGAANGILESLDIELVEIDKEIEARIESSHSEEISSTEAVKVLMAESYENKDQLNKLTNANDTDIKNEPMDEPENENNSAVEELPEKEAKVKMDKTTRENDERTEMTSSSVRLEDTIAEPGSEYTSLKIEEKDSSGSESVNISSPGIGETNIEAAVGNAKRDVDKHSITEDAQNIPQTKESIPMAANEEEKSVEGSLVSLFETVKQTDAQNEEETADVKPKKAIVDDIDSRAEQGNVTSDHIELQSENVEVSTAILSENVMDELEEPIVSEQSEILPSVGVIVATNGRDDSDGVSIFNEQEQLSLVGNITIPRLKSRTCLNEILLMLRGQIGGIERLDFCLALKRPNRRKSDDAESEMTNAAIGEGESMCPSFWLSITAIQFQDICIGKVLRNKSSLRREKPSKKMMDSNVAINRSDCALADAKVGHKITRVPFLALIFPKDNPVCTLNGTQAMGTNYGLSKKQRRPHGDKMKEICLPLKWTDVVSISYAVLDSDENSYRSALYNICSLSPDNVMEMADQEKSIGAAEDCKISGKNLEEFSSLVSASEIDEVVCPLLSLELLKMMCLPDGNVSTAPTALFSNYSQSEFAASRFQVADEACEIMDRDFDLDGFCFVNKTALDHYRRLLVFGASVSAVESEFFNVEQLKPKRFEFDAICFVNESVLELYQTSFFLKRLSFCYSDPETVNSDGWESLIYVSNNMCFLNQTAFEVHQLQSFVASLDEKDPFCEDQNKCHEESLKHDDELFKIKVRRMPKVLSFDGKCFINKTAKFLHKLVLVKLNYPYLYKDSLLVETSTTTSKKRKKRRFLAENACFDNRTSFESHQLDAYLTKGNVPKSNVVIDYPYNFEINVKTEVIGNHTELTNVVDQADMTTSEIYAPVVSDELSKEAGVASNDSLKSNDSEIEDPSEIERSKLAVEETFISLGVDEVQAGSPSYQLEADSNSTGMPVRQETFILTEDTKNPGNTVTNISRELKTVEAFNSEQLKPVKVNYQVDIVPNETISSKKNENSDVESVPIEIFDEKKVGLERDLQSVISTAQTKEPRGFESSEFKTDAVNDVKKVLDAGKDLKTFTSMGSDDYQEVEKSSGENDEANDPEQNRWNYRSWEATSVTESNRKNIVEIKEPKQPMLEAIISKQSKNTKREQSLLTKTSKPDTEIAEPSKQAIADLKSLTVSDILKLSSEYDSNSNINLALDTTMRDVATSEPIDTSSQRDNDFDSSLKFLSELFKQLQSTNLSTSDFVFNSGQFFLKASSIAKILKAQRETLEISVETADSGMPLQAEGQGNDDLSNSRLRNITCGERAFI